MQMSYRTCSMCIVDLVRTLIIVDNGLQSLNIKSSRDNIARNQHSRRARHESLQNLRPMRREHVRVECLNAERCCRRLFGGDHRGEEWAETIRVVAEFVKYAEQY